MTKIGPFIVGNPKGWGIWGVVTAGAGFLGGITAATIVGVPALLALGFVSAAGGNAMYQLPPDVGRKH